MSRLMRSRRPSPKQIADVAVVLAATIFVLVQMSPSLLLADTTPAGGDMGAHVWAPAFLRDHLLPDLRLTGWTPDWYAGFPAMHFYMVVPMLAIVALDTVLPYGVAFKLVTASGVVAMPAAAFAFGKLTRARFPGPALMALAATLFLFDQSFQIYGGNIPSTLAGEFAFSISLALALAFLGVFAHSLQTGRNRSLAAVLLALTALNHLIPAIFAAMGALALLIVVTVDDQIEAFRLGATRLRDTLWRPLAARAGLVATVGVVGGAIGAFWALPFFWRRAYLNDMGWEKLTDYFDQLVPEDLRWVLALAVAGALVSIVLRVRLGMALALLAILLAVAFVLMPQGRLWNARLLPFYFLVLYMLAGLAVAEVLRALAQAITPDPTRPIVGVTAGGLAVVALATFAYVGKPLDAVPDALPVPGASDSSFIPSWVRWNYSGYERKDAYPEYHSILTTMQGIGEERGCGRAMWEYEKGLDRYGTPMALMLLPHWTDGCIGSMEGLYFEASATTPYHFLLQSELSAGPSRPQRDLPYRTLLHRTDTNGDGQVTDDDGGDIDQDVFNAGVEHLQLLGVRYYLAFTGPVVDAAHEHPELTFVGRSSPWEVFEVADATIVEPLAFEPVVVPGLDRGGHVWQDAAVAAYQAHEGDGDDVVLAADGPGEWIRTSRDEALATSSSRRLPEVTVSGIDTDTDRISFDVDRPGVPVLVKTSYFPNWQADGADGPYRVSPNLMVVVPTEEHVELSYGRTPIDIAAWLITFLGIAAAVWIWRRGPAELHLPDLPSEVEVPPGPPPDPVVDEPPAGAGVGVPADPDR